MEKEKCSLFEEMLMWTSYRYCIGRKSYVSSMSDDIGVHYYNKLPNDRKQFTAEDIRREISNNLNWLPFNFTIYRTLSEDKFDPIGVLMKFFEKENIKSYDNLANYSKVTYDVHKDKFEFNKQTPTIKPFFDRSDLEGLIRWDRLASLFDVDNHKIVTLTDGTEVEAFYIWSKNLHKLEGTDYYQFDEFGWHKELVPVKEYIEKSIHVYIPEKNIKEIKDLKK